MKFTFEAELPHQMRAIESVCDLFIGQEAGRSGFVVSRPAPVLQHTLGVTESELGIGNSLSLSDEALLANVRSIQGRNGLAQATRLESGDFTVEMETGTGKTYVYLRTIMELNRRFGFVKFVIVVPSVAIKEGVYKTLQITEEHFRSLYDGTPFEYFVYDSSRLGQVRNFAASAEIQIMIVTVGAINKNTVNNFYKGREETFDHRPIDLIRATHPIIVVDEPQSVDGGLTGAGKTALLEMGPLCTLRYSATHVNEHHMVYRLDAVDAYEQHLVKQIAVASATVETAHNKPFVRLVAINDRRGIISARVIVDVQGAKGPSRKEISVEDGTDLESQTQRPLYRGHRIGEIVSAPGRQSLELIAGEEETYLSPGDAWGDLDPLILQRAMIRRTIREHLEKAQQLHPRGIKVLSLFFVESVEQYRCYDAAGNATKGPCALIFEEEYLRLSRHPDFRGFLADTPWSVADVHNGYFSVDRKNTWTDTSEKSQASREDAERAYSLIMKEKEKLLELSTPLAFIFSHSALREGWDNPNVFQLCTLRDIRTERERRQTIGRGLRLCVNQKGERVRDPGVNVLTVIATESYEDFAKGLQNELEQSGIRFGIVETHQFADILVASEDGNPYPMGAERSMAVWEYLRAHGYIDVNGSVQDSLRSAIRAGNVPLPDEFADQADRITAVLRRLAGRVEIQNADAIKAIIPRHDVLGGEYFRDLWDRIKYKTTYRVNFDSKNLIHDCVLALRNAPAISKTRLHWRKADIAIGRAGVEPTERAGAETRAVEEDNLPLPNILSELQARTQLTRRTLQTVLLQSGRLHQFRLNPQQFIEIAAGAINRCKHLVIAGGISYALSGDEEYFSAACFEQRELNGYMPRMIPDVGRKSVYNYVPCDSDVEARFAQQLEKNSQVKLFAKLPTWFSIPTPLGAYHPDWAMLVEHDDEERLYLVAETKGSRFAADLRDTERAKTECARVHFRAVRVMEPPALYCVGETLDDVLDEAASDR